jgi:hypothetical protein
MAARSCTVTCSSHYWLFYFCWFPHPVRLGQPGRACLPRQHPHSVGYRIEKALPICSVLNNSSCFRSRLMSLSSSNLDTHFSSGSRLLASFLYPRLSTITKGLLCRTFEVVTDLVKLRWSSLGTIAGRKAHQLRHFRPLNSYQLNRRSLRHLHLSCLKTVRLTAYPPRASHPIA